MIRFEHYRKKVKLQKIIFDIVLIYFFAILFVIFFNSLIFQAFKIPSNSMEPQITENSLILVNKFSLGIKYPFSEKRIINKTSDLKRGDIIVFMSNEYYKKNKFLRDISSLVYILTFSVVDFYNFDKTNSNIMIKRIIGIPGDTIKYSFENGKSLVLINNIEEKNIIRKKYKIVEENINNSPMLDKMMNKIEYKVKGNEYYVLGDNRISSIDSRIWFGIKSEQIIGKALLKYYPKIEVLK